MVRRILCFLLLTATLAGCGLSAQQKKKRQEEELVKLAKEVMAEHDKEMPKTGQIFKLKRQLGEIEMTVTDSTVLKELYACRTDLEKADAEMMDWMHHYKGADTFMPFEEQKQHYLNEKQKIMDVGNHIDQSIARAQSFIEQYAQKQN